jgi:hypothetical protein
MQGQDFLENQSLRSVRALSLYGLKSWVMGKGTA